MNAQTLINNETFMKELVNKGTVEEVKDLFCEYGLDVSEDEVRTALSMLDEKGGKETLTEAELDCVSGGIAIATCYLILDCAMLMIGGKPFYQLITLRK